MQTMIPTPTYSEAVNRKKLYSYYTVTVTVDFFGGDKNAEFSQDVTHTNNQSRSIQKIPPQETPKAIPVIISQGSKQTQVRENSGKQQLVITRIGSQEQRIDSQEQRIDS